MQGHPTEIEPSPQNAHFSTVLKKFNKNLKILNIQGLLGLVFEANSL